MIRFATPLALLLALLGVDRVYLLTRDRRTRFGAFRFSSLSIVDAKRTFRARTSMIPFAIEIFAMLCMVVALARPQRVTRASAGDRFGIDIVVALDASGSMAAED